MKYGDYIRNFTRMRQKDEILFKCGLEETTFCALVERTCELVEKNNQRFGIGQEDFYSVVADTYDMLFPIVRCLVDMQEETRKAYEEYLKYGTKITVTTEEMDALKKEIQKEKDEQ